MEERLATIDLGDRPAGVVAMRESGADQLNVGDRVTAAFVQPESPDGRVEPTALFKVGQAVRVVMVGIDKETQRISLSIKRLADDPWRRFLSTVQCGQTMEATVTRVMPYGALARGVEA